MMDWFDSLSNPERAGMLLATLFAFLFYRLAVGQLSRRLYRR